MQKKNIFLTTAYNAELTIDRAICSVLNQTWQDFEYWIVDNGSTDGTREKIKAYAVADSRITAFYYNENYLWRAFDFIHKIARESRAGWLVILDSDDEYLPPFLEKMLEFVEANHLDFAATGNNFVNAETGEATGNRSSDHNVVFTRETHNFLGEYHAIMRPVWAKLIPLEIVASINFEDYYSIRYGGDTAFILDIISRCNRFGIMAGTYYQYYVNPKSDSYTWDNRRLEADRIMYQHGVGHCQKMWGHISPQNQTFLYAVYANAVLDTMNIIHNSGLTSEEKLHEYADIAAHPITQMAYRCPEQSCKRSRENLLGLVCIEGLKLREENEDLKRALQALLPRCGLAVTAKNLPLLLSRELKERFLQDDRDGLVKTLLPLLPRIKNPQRYDPGTTLQRLAVEHPLLFQVNDLAFLQSYTELYLLLWDNRNLEALDQMTGLLLEGKMVSGQETFLTLYIDLAALENQVPAFLFGKTRLAQYYLDQGDSSPCREILQELDEMGVGDQEDVVQLKALLEDKKPMT